MRIAGIVLAGGRSTRMEGRDKALLSLSGRPFVAWCLERLAPQVEAVAINTNADAEPFASFGVPLVRDTVPNYAGPLAGILAGLEWAAAEYDALVTVPVDAPFLPLDLVARLAAPGGCAVAASAGRLHPVAALWPVALAAPLRHFLASAGTGRVTAFLDQVGFATVDFPAMPFDPFFNVNTPAGFTEAERIARDLA